MLFFWVISMLQHRNNTGPLNSRLLYHKKKTVAKFILEQPLKKYKYETIQALGHSFYKIQIETNTGKQG